MDQEQYLDALLSLPLLYEDTRILRSRDGRWIAWTWFNVGAAADVFAAPVDGSLPPIRLTDTPDDTYLVSWTPDSRALLVEQDRNGNERAQLFRVEIDRPLEMVPLTEPDPNYFLRGGQLHPNLRWLIYGANFDVASNEEIEPTWVYRHDLETGERVPLAKPLKPIWTFPELNSTGTHVLYQRKELHRAGAQVWLVDIEGKKDEEVLNFGADLKTYARWTPDGRRAVVLAETKTHRRLGLWDLETRQVRWLLDDPARDLQEAYMPWGSAEIVLVESKQGRTVSSLLDPESGTERQVKPSSGTLVPLVPASGDDWLGIFYSSLQPQDIVRFSLHQLGAKKFRSLTGIWERTSLTLADLTPAEDFSWRSVDDLEVHGWLYRTKKEPKGTVAYIHGGPTWHTQDWVNNQIQFLAHEGFNVLDVNYRGSTGYGIPFQEAIKEDGWGGREQEDIRTGIEALIQAGIAEEGKVGITGTSYGGYSAWYAITHLPPEIVGASAPICGMTDLVVDYETTRPDLRPYSEEMMGGTPEQVPERYHQRSPINCVEQIKGRLLIVQGAQDPNVTPENVRLVREKLEEAAIPYEMLVFEDEGHGVSKPRNKRALYLRLAEFFTSAFS